MIVKYLNGFDDCKEVSKNINLILGMFDGVHVGHTQLIKTAKYLSKNKLGVITFNMTLKSDDKRILMSLEDKIKKFESIGVDELYIINCDENFKKMSYIDFINKVLNKFEPQKIFCGQDFRFGYKAQGDVNILKSYFNDVVVLNYVNRYNGEKISSSIIKEFIQEGKTEEANRYLGEIYKIKGVVTKGKGNGKKLGFPTANLSLSDNYYLPKNGVYISKTIIDGKSYFSMTNIGYNPTIKKLNKISIETYILDFKEDIYKKNISIEFYKNIREEKTFSSIDELIEQLNHDKNEVIEYFKLS